MEEENSEEPQTYYSPLEIETLFDGRISDSTIRVCIQKSLVEAGLRITDQNELEIVESDNFNPVVRRLFQECSEPVCPQRNRGHRSSRRAYNEMFIFRMLVAYGWEELYRPLPDNFGEWKTTLQIIGRNAYQSRKNQILDVVSGLLDRKHARFLLVSWGQREMVYSPHIHNLVEWLHEKTSGTGALQYTTTINTDEVARFTCAYLAEIANWEDREIYHDRIFCSVICHRVFKAMNMSVTDLVDPRESKFDALEMVPGEYYTWNTFVEKSPEINGTPVLTIRLVRSFHYETLAVLQEEHASERVAQFSINGLNGANAVAFMRNHTVPIYTETGELKSLRYSVEVFEHLVERHIDRARRSYKNLPKTWFPRTSRKLSQVHGIDTRGNVGVIIDHICANNPRFSAEAFSPQGKRGTYISPVSISIAALVRETMGDGVDLAKHEGIFEAIDKVAAEAHLADVGSFFGLGIPDCMLLIRRYSSFQKLEARYKK